MADKMDSESLVHQANSVWHMLNDLADSNPEAYKKLMDKTLKDGSEQFKPPQPCFCISTIMLSNVFLCKMPRMLSIEESLKDDGKSNQVQVTIELPNVSSVNQCELDVSETDVLLNVPSLYSLQVDLPQKVDDSQVTASFNKTKKVLIIKLPTVE
ncbi:hypothetical protein QZH41_011683 [Actinostola sp. cb2023]|nr:hypothetical protein QZH41_011683 [Actinostola sp. cb2023]